MFVLQCVFFGRVFLRLALVSCLLADCFSSSQSGPRMIFFSEAFNPFFFLDIFGPMVPCPSPSAPNLPPPRLMIVGFVTGHRFLSLRTRVFFLGPIEQSCLFTSRLVWRCWPCWIGGFYKGDVFRPRASFSPRSGLRSPAITFSHPDRYPNVL